MICSLILQKRCRSILGLLCRQVFQLHVTALKAACQLQHRISSPIHHCCNLIQGKLCICNGFVLHGVKENFDGAFFVRIHILHKVGRAALTLLCTYILLPATAKGQHHGQRKQPALHPLSDPDFSSFHFLPHFLLQLQPTFLLPDILLRPTDNEISCSLSITISNHLSQSTAPAPHESKDDGN